MTKVKIYQFRKYDISIDSHRKSRRWGTKEAIARVQGEPLEETGIEVDESALSDDAPGMTAIGFMPHSNTGFQRQVTG